MIAPLRAFSEHRCLAGLALVASAVSVLLLASGCENTADPLAPEAGGATGAGGAMSAYGDRYTDPDRTRQREETYLRMNDERGYPRDPY